MKLTIRTHHASITDGFEEQAEEKLGRLERWLPRVDDVVVELTYEETRSSAHRYQAQVTVHSGPAILRAEERGPDPRTALELAADVLARQARRHKTRLRDRHQAGVKGTPPEEPARGETEPEGEYIAGKIVRVKRFEAKPMSQEEALAQMDLLGHDFFLFQDADTREYALLYKRKDGGYGLLSPQARR